MSPAIDERQLVWIEASRIRSGYLSLNLRHAKRRRPELAEAVEWAVEYGAALYGFKKGCRGIQAVRFRTGEQWELWYECENSLLPALVQSAQDAASSADLLILVGLGLGTVALKVFERIRGENRGLFVVEPRAEFVLAAFAAQELTDLISSGQVFFAAGPRWCEQLSKVITEHHLAAATPAIRPAIDPSSAWGKTILPATATAVDLTMREAQPRLQQELDQFIASRRSPSRRPGRVIWAFQDSRRIASYSLIQVVLLRTLFYQLTRLGWTVRYTHLRDGYYYPPYYRIWEMVRARPDILFFCNVAPAFEFVLGPRLSRSLALPKVIWHADDPLYCQHLYLRHGTTRDEFYLAADHGWIDQLRCYGAGDRVEFMPGGATVTRPGKRCRRLAAGIVFVGQIRDNSQFFRSLSAEHRRYCEQVIADKIANPRVSLATIMSRYTFPGKLLREDLMDELRHKILWEANSRHRLKLAQQLEDLGLVIYGNPAWLRRLPDGPNRDRFRGTIPFKKLSLVYRNATITLNMHSLQTYTCLNVRDFDVPASGGFLVTDWVPRVEEFFAPGFAADLPLKAQADPEVFLYRNIQELRRIVTYFLEHPHEREPIIERARQRVWRDHTYANRAQALSNLLVRLMAEGI